jgi:cyclopropane fatty-acyl-phospholipid synthase-like methyltransferase/DUF1365 family protein
MSSLYDVEVSHVRAAPVRHDVRRRSYLWFVDLDEISTRNVPAPRLLAGFRASDHVGDPSRTLRENVVSLIAEHGFDIGAGRITMLTQARTFGYVFNPLTLFWCHDESGSVVCVVAEVHNTYGQRHAYVLSVDDAGRAEVDKQFYVSPFYPVDGYYRMSVPEPTDNLAITITLHRPDDRLFTASLRGVRRRASRAAVLRTSLRYPLAPLVGRLDITRHGIALWRAGLHVQARPGERDPKRGTRADQLASLFRDIAGADMPLRIRAWDGSEAGPLDGPVLVIRSRRALRRLLWAPGELGLARAYVTGDLDVEGDLTDGFRQVWRQVRAGQLNRVELTVRQRLSAAAAAARLGAVGLPPTPPRSEARLTGRRHSASRDRAAIAHHYDMSNEFYGLLLDETMAYSSAYFTDTDQPLVDAQRAKLDLICRKLQLESGMRLLDVGCGWGSLILHAAEHYGVHATGVTLSAAQRDHIVKQVADRGLADRVTVRLQDYRDVEQHAAFDAVSSIEMGEHVGEEQYPVYASIMYGALRPGGRLLLQQMSRHRGTAPGGGAFIESYIAPDMHMRPLPETLAFLEGAGFEIRDVQAMREHYVTTVRHWIDTFEARYPEFVALVGEEVARVWRLYLVGGALAFDEGRMGVDQILAVR